MRGSLADGYEDYNRAQMLSAIVNLELVSYVYLYILVSPQHYLIEICTEFLNMYHTTSLLLSVLWILWLFYFQVSILYMRNYKANIHSKI